MQKRSDAYFYPDLELADPKTLQGQLWPRVKRQLEHAERSCAFYAHHFEEAGIRAAEVRDWDDFFARVPSFSKQTIIQLQQASSPFGALCGVERSELVRIYASPGPLYGLFTQDDYVATSEHMAWGLYTSGVRSDDVATVTVSFHWVAGGTIVDAGYRRVGAAVVPVGTGLTRAQLDLMRDLEVTTTFIFTTFADELARTAQEAGIDLHRDLALRHLVITGEIGRDEVKDRLMADFDADVREMYGSGDFTSVAAECPHGGGMHLNPQLIVEVVDPETGDPVAPGEPGELVITEYARRAMPFLRYRTGDLTRGINPEPCACGRRTPRIGRILGRTGDILRVKGQFIVPRQVSSVLEQHRELGRYQIVAERPEHVDVLRIRVEGPGDRGETYTEQLAEELRQIIKVRPLVEVVAPGTIPRDALQVEDRRVIS